ncbi:MAG: hypothetical protein KC619_04865 [Myxococcales bacterium]|nr:hypothetical protein [Myxococcales bacterium]
MPAQRTTFHLRFGWWSLLFFLTLGVVLEAMHGFKIGWYLDVDNEVRRLMLTLAHAHGALLGLVHVAFAATVHIAGAKGWATIFASRGLVLASVLLPLGFLIGAFGISGGDPGVGIVLVPAGAVVLFGAVGLAAWSVRSPAR